MTLDQDDITEAAKFLLKYLKSNDSLEAFIRNAVSYRDEYDLKEKLEEYLNPQVLMDDAFIWVDTPEGHSFWSELSDGVNTAWKQRETD